MNNYDANVIHNTLFPKVYNNKKSIVKHVKSLLVDKFSFNPARVEYFLIAIDEMYENAQRENKKHFINGPSRIDEIFVIPKSYNIIIENEGVFDPKSIPVPFTKEKPSLKNHGRGIYLSRAMTDSLSYSIASLVEDKLESTEVYIMLEKNGISLPKKNLDELMVVSWP